MLKLLTPISAAILLSGCVIHISPDSANITEQQELTLSAQDIKTLISETSSGNLNIMGVEGLNEILVKADIRTYNHDKSYTLTLEKHGNKAKLVAKHNAKMGFYSGNSPRINLTIQVPATLALDLEDGSGDIEIKGSQADITVNDNSGNIIIAGGKNVVIDDGSGNIEITEVTGNMMIDDGSGNLSIDGGNQLVIDDGSGNLSIANLTGSLKVTDGSGNLDITEVQGNVDVEDGSGNLHISHLASSLVVRDDSGELSIENIQGDVNIDDGSGDLSVSKVVGVVTIEDGSGNIEVNNTGGLVITESGSGSLNMHDINGVVNVKN